MDDTLERRRVCRRPTPASRRPTSTHRPPTFFPIVHFEQEGGVHRDHSSPSAPSLHQRHRATHLELLLSLSSPSTCKLFASLCSSLPSTRDSYLCFVVHLLSNKSALGNLAQIEAAIKGGFHVKWKEDIAVCYACTKSKGVCGYDVNNKNRWKQFIHTVAILQ
ncbi:hypothetical protein I3760_02G037700 [Carya illinoinensis]|nr:hypothetical protein I3760_02G037700 [Carya illinoinensis]